MRNGHRRAAPASIVIAIALTAAASGQTAAPTSTSPPVPTARTAAQVIAGMQSFSKDLKSYAVPVTLRGGVKVSFVTVPFEAQGMEYYRAPNKQAVHLEGAPALAQRFQNTVATMGSPQTWPLDYSMSLVVTQQNNGHLAYHLVGPPKKTGSTVKNVSMWVAAKTFALQTVSFSYQNGSSLSLNFGHHGLSPYHLPTHVTVTAKFTSYSGNAELIYGTYRINASIPDSMFTR
ncbi:MAG TPA: hypothetical protein VGK84_10720 [Candidatus Tumulicola sp.]